ncbi:ComF family protein [Desulfovibrio legallii]|uniref:ComF family protein n=1 Tax=Desulfovibrio legallii TaxID=571438 RepID=A0A1G7HYS0_9BACT|nr:phosphoribosyltransferase family protein [Desulfovibrio legallii]SDF05661.1 comF family protein [Desulfovibrio legallii]
MNGLPPFPALPGPAAWPRLLGLLGLRQRRCLHCLAPFVPAPNAAGHNPEALLCPACRPLLGPYAGPRCPACGLPPPDFAQRTDLGGLCGRCLTEPPPWSGLAFYGLYTGELRHLLLRLKFDGHLYLAPLLAGLLLRAARHLPRPDALLAVPQHPAHLRRRGYNQAHELARALAASAGLPLRPVLLRRTAPGPAQSTLTAAQRRANVRHSFAAAAEAQGLRLWLLDDVMTTGSTLAAAVTALRAAGAAAVDVLAVARTPLDEHST